MGRGSVRSYLLLACFLSALPFGASAESPIERGKYLFDAAGCYSCHTDVKNKGPALAGGRALKTPFGTFYTPNITPDRATGIGRWSDADFISALRDGVSPDGANYYPVFPYTSYTRMTDADILDLKAYLFSQAPVENANKPHDVGFPFSWRFLTTLWKWLFFERGTETPVADRAILCGR